MEIESAYDAYWFLYNHPHQIDEHPDHPLVEANKPAEDEDALEWLLRQRKYTPEYSQAVKEQRVIEYWNGQLINNLSIFYGRDDTHDHPNWSHDYAHGPCTLPVEVYVGLETGPAYWNEYTNEYASNSHDPSLDVSGKTFDEALINLANKVKEIYGDT